MARQKTEEIKKAIVEALNQISRDYEEIMKEISELRSRVEKIEKEIRAVEINIVKKIEEAIDRLEKIGKMIYWHRRTVEQNKQYSKQYRGYKGGKPWRRSWKTKTSNA